MNAQHVLSQLAELNSSDLANVQLIVNLITLMILWPLHLSVTGHQMAVGNALGMLYVRLLKVCIRVWIRMRWHLVG